MNTKLVQSDEKGIQQAVELLQQGEVVAIPTETVYGLAANALDGKAVEKIFAAKGRPQDNPLIVHIDSIEMWKTLVEPLPPEAVQLAQAFWPGPLTIILRHKGTAAPEVCGGLDTIAVRMPSHPIAKEIIAKSGLPLAAPSANLSGSPSPTEAKYVWQDMQGRIPLVVDGGSCQVGVESTVVSLAEESPVLLRPGYITKEQMEQVLGKPVKVAGAVTRMLEQGETALSPGMKYKHYAPNAEITILKGDADQYRNYINQHKEEGVAALCFEEDCRDLSVPVVVYGKEKDFDSQARELFSALRHLDEMGAKKVYARCPEVPGVALAVYNRLLRAAAFRVVEL